MMRMYAAHRHGAELLDGHDFLEIEKGQCTSIPRPAQNSHKHGNLAPESTCTISLRNVVQTACS